MSDRDERPRDDAASDGPGAPEPAFDDPGHAWVRDVLADARVTTPPPPEVVSRLDDALAALVAERGRAGPPAEEPAATVVPLRRRLAPRLAAAAAAVIVVAAGGVALTRLDLGGSPNADSASSADSAAGAGASPGEPGSTKGFASGGAPEALADAGLPSLRTASFAADAAAVMRRVAGTQLAGTQDDVGSPSPTAPVPGETPAQTPALPGSTSARGPSASKAQAPPVTATPQGLSTDQPAPGPARCVGPAPTDAITLPATLDGTPVALVFRPPTAAGQVVEAWSCDGRRVLASATVAP